MNQTYRSGLSASAAAFVIFKLAIRSHMKCQAKYFVSLIQWSAVKCMTCLFRGTHLLQ